MFNTNILNLFQGQFGYKPSLSERDLPPAPGQRRESALGAPLYGQDAIGREYFLPVTIGGVTLPYPVVRIQGRKNIVETQMVNRKGSVKELISIDDYRILVRGIIIDHTGNWPEEQITLLRDLYLRNEALPIQSALTDIFLGTSDGGGDNVVILSLEFPEQRGAKNVTGYVMELVSDQELVLTVD